MMVYFECWDLVGVGREITASANNAGSSLKWHGFAVRDAAAMGNFIPLRVLVMCFAACFSTIWFFFQMRRKHSRRNGDN